MNGSTQLQRSTRKVSAGRYASSGHIVQPHKLEKRTKNSAEIKRRESETLVKHEFSAKTDAREGERKKKNERIACARYVALKKNETAALCSPLCFNSTRSSTAIKEV